MRRRKEQTDDQKIRNCRFVYQCSKKWRDLTLMLSEGPNIRFCEECQQCVFLCKTDRQLEKAIRNSRCVAVTFMPSSSMAMCERRFGGPVESLTIPNAECNLAHAGEIAHNPTLLGQHSTNYPP